LIELEGERRRRQLRAKLLAAAVAVFFLGVCTWAAVHVACRDDGKQLARRDSVPSSPILDDAESAAQSSSSETGESDAPRESPDPSILPALAVKLAERGTSILERVATPVGASDPSAALDGGDQVARTPPDGRGTAGFYAEIREIAESQLPSVKVPLVSRLDQFRQSLRSANGEAWRTDANDALDSREPTEPSKALLFALRSDPEVSRLLGLASVDRADSQVLVRLIGRLKSTAQLRLRVIDLDDGGNAFAGAEIYGRAADIGSGVLGPARFLGRSPVIVGLDAGDWRLVAVDRRDPAATRHSELRLLALPGEDLGVRVAFMRKTDEVTDGMARFEACSFRFGVPATLRSRASDLPETTLAAPGLWIDPYEVSCDEYSRFFREIEAHPEWFDGMHPVHRPSVLLVDGTPVPGMSRRAIAGITWDEGVLFANWAGKRLPTEREWERVARGSTAENRDFPWGAAPPSGRINDKYSWTSMIKQLALQGRRAKPPRYAELSGSDVDADDYAIGATPPDAGDQVFRLADNVSEFTEDLYVERSPTGGWTLLDVDAIVRVARGGNWLLADEEHSRPWIRTAAAAEGGMFFGLRAVKTDLSDALGN
jgi:formylglycine-generating enzyme required for sulfatase activity